MCEGGVFLTALKINKKSLKSFLSQCLQAIPPTLVYLTMYFLIQAFFGSENAIIVSSMTLVFRRLRSERFVERIVLKTMIMYIGLSLLAFVSTQSIITTIIFNLLIPFFLVYFTTDDYKPGGDFPFTMVFMYMQLIPVNLHGLSLRIIAILVGLIIVYISIKIFIIFKPADTEHSLCKKGLENIIKQYESLVKKDFKTTKKYQLELFEINEKLSDIIYQRRKNKYFSVNSAGLYFNFIIIFQHIDSLTSKLINNKELLTEYNINYFIRLTYLLKESVNNFDNPNQDNIISKLIEFSVKNSVDDLMLNTELMFNIDSLTIALNDISSRRKRKIASREHHSRLIVQKELKRPDQLRHKMNVNSFKFCFGIRLSIVMVITFAISFFINESYSYWLPMSAFLMIRPFYDESKERIIKRIIGTIIGIIVSFGLFYIFRDPNQLFVLTLIFVFGMYAMENYAAVVVFATCFSLSMVVFASTTVGAAWLRLIYTVTGGIISMLASKYILPFKYYDEFKNMADKIIYIDILMAQSLSRLVYSIHEGDMFRELIIESYMVSAQLESMYYSSNIKKGDGFIEELTMINNQLVTDMANAYDLLSIQNIQADYQKELMKILQLIKKNLEITRKLISGDNILDEYKINDNMVIVNSSKYINKTIIDCFKKSVELKNIVDSKKVYI